MPDENSTTTKKTSAKNLLQPTILVIEDNPDDLRVLSNYIGDLGKIVFASTGEEGIRMAEQTHPELILLDIELPDIMGPTVFKRLQGQSDAAVIFVTSHRSATHQIAALESGAVDFISKPYSPEVIRNSVAEQLQKRASRKAKLAKNRDRLTNAYNRAYFDALVEMNWQAQKAQGGTLALALVQIDAFDLYLESFGNLNADACLKKIAKALNQPFNDVQPQLARYAHDKFALMYPGITIEQIPHWGHHLVDCVHNLAIPHSNSQNGDLVTASVGVSSAKPREDQNCRILIEGAYNALSSAREAGHNRFAIVKV